MAELGDEVWQGNLCPEQRGVVVLGTPIGHPDLERLLSQLPKLPDLNGSWLLLLLCTSPRANHALRTVPPLDIQAYARGHDQAVWHTLKQCLGGATEAEAPYAKNFATLPAHLGVLGLLSAERTSPATYWAGLGLADARARPRRLAAWMAVLRVAHPQPTLSRQRATASRDGLRVLPGFMPPSCTCQSAAMTCRFG